MIDIVAILLGIIVLFAVFIWLRSAFSLKVCALCAAVSVTWIVLLVLFYIGSFTDLLIIGILLGGSAVGVVYLLEGKFSESFQVFKLPFYLTLILAIYFVLQQNLEFKAVIVLVLLWIFVGVIYVGRNTIRFKILARKIVECCKNW